MKSIQLLVVIIVLSLHVSICSAAELLSREYIPGTAISLSFPQKYSLRKSSEYNRNGSFISYDIYSDEGGYPSLSEILFCSINSLKEFEKMLAKLDDLNPSGDACGTLPTVKEYNNSKRILNNPSKYKTKYEIKRIGGRYYNISTYDCNDAIVREYRTFAKDIMIDIVVFIAYANNLEQQKGESDKLVSQLTIE